MCGGRFDKTFHTPVAHRRILIGSALATEEDIDIAVRSSRKAFNTSWGKHVTGTERGRLLYKLADLMERDQQILAELESLDNGKPVRIARFVAAGLSKIKI